MKLPTFEQLSELLDLDDLPHAELPVTYLYLQLGAGQKGSDVVNLFHKTLDSMKTLFIAAQMFVDRGGTERQRLHVNEARDKFKIIARALQPYQYLLVMCWEFEFAFQVRERQ